MFFLTDRTADPTYDFLNRLGYAIFPMGLAVLESRCLDQQFLPGDDGGQRGGYFPLAPSAVKNQLSYIPRGGSFYFFVCSFSTFFLLASHSIALLGYGGCPCSSLLPDASLGPLPGGDFSHPR